MSCAKNLVYCKPRLTNNNPNHVATGCARDCRCCRYQVLTAIRRHAERARCCCTDVPVWSISLFPFVVLNTADADPSLRAGSRPPVKSAGERLPPRSTLGIATAGRFGTPGEVGFAARGLKA
ncbi:unnamed protein product, partial [Mycena citricolor]